MPEDDKPVMRMEEALREKDALLESSRLQIEQLGRQLEDATLRLEAANHEIESLSYSVSHDLRAPLRAMNGNAQILQEDFGDRLDGDARKYLKRILDNAARMEQLISDILLFSRIGRKELRKAQVDMNALVEEIFSDIARTEPHKAYVKIEPLPEAYGDYALLRRVWTNLISNAIKYSAKKERPVIQIGAKNASGRVTYYIADNGAGFDMAYAGKLFGTFQRLHDTTEFEGTGIGLAIAHRIILKHGGTIWAEAAPEQGATFWFTL